MSNRQASRRAKLEEDKLKIEARIEDSAAPPHPDEGREQWSPDKTMEVTSGRICFGLGHEVESGAKEEEMSFEDAMFYYSDLCLSGPAPHNTVAKNGTWYAYKLIDRDPRCKEYYPDSKPEDHVTGWFICHKDLVGDPVVEVRDMIYNTFNEDNGGEYEHWSYETMDGIMGSSNRTHPIHATLGYVLIPRYAMGYNMPSDTTLTGKEEQKILKEGIFVVDYATAKKDRSSWKKNGICNIHGYGDYDVGRLQYNDEGLCEAFLLTGTAAQFQTAYFTIDGTAPLGKPHED